MRVLLVPSNFFAPGNPKPPSGVAVNTLNVAKAMQNIGIDVAILTGAVPTPENKGTVVKDSLEGVKVFRSPAFPLGQPAIPRAPQPLVAASDAIAAVRDAYKQVREQFGFDVIAGQDLQRLGQSAPHVVLGTAAEREGSPFTLTQHTPGDVLMFGDSIAALGPNQAVLNSVPNHMLRPTPAFKTVVPGIELEAFEDVQVDRELIAKSPALSKVLELVDAGKKIVLSPAARGFELAKGIGPIVRAHEIYAAQDPSIATIIGDVTPDSDRRIKDGIDRRLETRHAGTDIADRFVSLGFASDEMPQLFAMVRESQGLVEEVSFSEGWPTALGQASQAGVPIVGNQILAHAPFQGPKIAWPSDRPNAQAQHEKLAEAILDITGDRTVWEKHSRAASDSAIGFGVDAAVTRDLLPMYNAAITSFESSSPEQRIARAQLNPIAVELATKTLQISGQSIGLG